MQTQLEAVDDTAIRAMLQDLCAMNIWRILRIMICIWQFFFATFNCFRYSLKAA